ncbi:PREDICTED: solute carrier organic anion transporter family member 4C1 isoform X3 [Pseudopodoces humilis]|uniref:solute carrier organic anion transporter family member 4C1 isoform X3 n=1 Tax=Pseudopodoces humilis TaxID=181119 RepID=UPI0006B85897|nr:PREDICTED: solute carrier organic anion transporter family member 4C1 isoform X3 [Pseudopodoces humilis]
MKGSGGGGIENPAFETPSSALGRRCFAGPIGAGADTAAPAGPCPGSEEGPCGWGPCTPRALQFCNNPKGYLAAYSLLAIFQGIVVNGLINISISTIEKRYELNSSLTGLISSSYDIAFCVLSLFVSYFGERGHKPRWLAFSAFMLGLGSLVFSLPHFSSGKYQYGGKIEDTCLTAETTFANSTCHVSTSSSLHKYLYVFILGQLLLGVGGTPLYTLGTAFIDDSVPKHMSSLYIGIGYSMSLLGPAIGYVLGGQLLKVYIDIQIPESTKVDQDDPRWLGAWWIGFLACFFAIWLLIIPFSCFPRRLPGLVLIPAAALGQVISGVLVSKCKMNCKGIIKFMISTCSVALILNTVFLFAKCGNKPFAGVSETYNGTGTLYNLTAPCNANCRCLRSMYYPVCGSDEVQYFSPCFAGCASYLFNNMKKTYYNCSCVGKTKRENGSEEFLYEAVPGKCPTQCKFLPLFLTFFFFAIVFTFMATTPTTVAILRCVPDKQRSFALGVQSVFLRLLGTIPGPILFGVAIDNSCTLWDINECETKGACWIYDNERMAFSLMGISAACKIITIIFVVMAVYFYKPPPLTKALPRKTSEKNSVIRT